MEVILLENVKKLGVLGERVLVRSGYGRNFLIPQGKAVPATLANVASFDARRTELERESMSRLSKAQERAQKLLDMVVTVVVKAGDEGKLFGSVGTRDLAEAISKAGVVVEKSEIRLPNGPLRNTGEYTIDVHVHSEVNASVRVNLIPE